MKSVWTISITTVVLALILCAIKWQSQTQVFSFVTITEEAPSDLGPAANLKNPPNEVEEVKTLNLALTQS
ncbi:MAG: hypothetical protein HRU19_03795 [Pseudobacteriovorax sp.]|nr:hypothetical protein [Pseudobacteriovorax sp.]